MASSWSGASSVGFLLELAWSGPRPRERLTQVSIFSGLELDGFVWAGSRGDGGIVGHRYIQARVRATARTTSPRSPHDVGGVPLGSPSPPLRLR